MSTSIEQRIVEMKFDREGFSKGVDATIKDLDKLDNSMQFAGGKEGLKRLQSSIDSVNFENMAEGINAIRDNLEKFRTFGDQIFRNLQNRVINWGIDMVKSLSVDQISGGFKEYELKMDSVRTIMSSTGASIDVVNGYLEELNKYSDKTIYSFSDMTNSIGKFTNAGVELEDAVSAIKGISSEAALAGAGTQQASAAMYNFAQALSSGSVKVIDWKSIENANMATIGFKKSLIDTAVAMGTVVKQGDKYVSTTTDANGNTSDLFDAFMGFNDSLSHSWLTKDVLIQSLKNYATDTREMTEAEKEAWKVQLKSIGYTEEQIAEIEKLGQQAMDAAQEVTTYSKMMDALKESVGSGWATTFEILFGDLEEAKVLWTGINNVVSGFIEGVSSTRNGILQLWKASGGHTALLEGFKSLWSIIKNVSEYIGLAFETITGHRFLQNFDDVIEFFGEGFKGNIVVIKRISQILIAMSYKFKEFAGYLKTFFDKDVEKSRHFLEEIYQAAQAIIIPLRFVYRVVTGIASKVLPPLFKIVATGIRGVIFLLSRIGYLLTEGEKQFVLYDIAEKIVSAVGTAINFIENKVIGLYKNIKGFLDKPETKEKIETLKKNVSDFIKDAHTKYDKFVTFVTTKFGEIKNKLQPIYSDLSKKWGNFSSKVKDFWTKTLKPTLDKLKTDLPELGKSIYTTVSNIFKTMWPVVQTIIDGIKDGFIFVKDGITNLFGARLKSNGFNNFSEFIRHIGEKALPTLQAGLGKVQGVFEFLANNIFPIVEKGFKKIVTAIKNVIKFVKQLYKVVKKKLTPLKDMADEIGGLFAKIDTDTGFIGGLKDKFDKLTEGVKSFFSEMKNGSEKDVDKAKEKIDEFVASGMTIEEATKKVENLNGNFEDFGGLLDFIGGKFQSFSDIIMNSTLVKTVTEFIDGVKKRLSENEILKNVLEVLNTVWVTIKDLFSYISSNVNFGDVLTTLFNDFMSLIENLKNVDYTNMSSGITGVADAFANFANSIESFSFSKFDEIMTAIQEFWQSLRPSADPKEDTELQQNIFERFTNIVWTAVAGLINGIATLNWENVFNIVKGILGLLAFKSLVGIFSKGEKAAKGLDKLTDVFANTLDKIASVFVTSKWTILSQAFMTFAKAMTYLTAAIVVLALIPPDDLNRALDAFTHLAFMYLVIYAVKGIIDKLTTNTSATDKAAEAGREAAENATKAVNNFLGSLHAFMESIAKGVTVMLKAIGQAFLVVGIGVAVAVIIFAIIQLSKEIDNGKIWDSLKVIGIVLLAVVGAIAILQKIDDVCETNLGDYVGLALMIFALSKIVSDFLKFHEVLKTIPILDLLASIGKFALVIGATEALLGAFLFLANHFGIQIAVASKSIGSLGLALLAFVAPMVILSFIPLDRVKSAIWAMVGIVGTMFLLNLAMDKIAKTTGGGDISKTFRGIAIGMIEMAAAMWIFSKAVGNFVTAAERIGQLGDAAIHVYALIGTFVGIIGLMVIGFIALSTVAAPVAPILLAIGAAVALVGLAFFFVGAGIDVASKGIVRLAENMDTIVNSVKGRESDVLNAVYTIAYGCVKAVADGIAYVLSLIGKGIIDAITMLNDNSYNMGYTMGDIIARFAAGLFVGMVHGLAKGFGYLWDEIGNLIDWFKNKISGKGEEVSDEVANKASEAVDKNDTTWANSNQTAVSGYYDKQKDAVDDGGDKVSAAAKEAASKTNSAYSNELQNGANGMPSSVAKAMEQSTQVINDKTPEQVAAAESARDQVAEAYNPTGLFTTNTQDALQATGNMLEGSMPSFITAGIEKGVGNMNVGDILSGNFIPGGEEAGENTANATIGSFSEMFGVNADGAALDSQSYLSEALTKYGNIPVDASGEVSMEALEAWTGGDFSSGGEAFDDSTADSIEDNADVVVEASENTIDEATNHAYAEAVVESGKVGDAMVDGVVLPLIRRHDEVTSLYGSVVIDAVNEMRAAGVISSPSKETESIANYLFDGLLKPVPSRGDQIVGAFGNVVTDILSTIRRAVSGSEEIFNEEMDYNPVITPVIDSSGIRYGVSHLTNMLNGNDTATISSRLNVARVDVGEAVGELGSITSRGNDEMLSELRKNTEATNALIKILKEQKLYLDSGRLVGALASGYDAELGRRALLAGRRG